MYKFKPQCSALNRNLLNSVDFVTARQGGLMAAYKERVESASTSCCDVSLHVDITSWNEETKKSMTTLAKEHGINSFCFTMSDRFQLNDEQVPLNKIWGCSFPIPSTLCGSMVCVQCLDKEIAKLSQKLAG